MNLAENGIDVFYIDESHDHSLYVVTAVTIPFMRRVNGVWALVWQKHFESAKNWRKRVQTNFKIPASKELHGVKLATGRGRYKYGKHQLGPIEGLSVYKALLSDIDFVPATSIMSVSGLRGEKLYGSERLERVMYALFQRMRMQCRNRSTNGMAFFDQGHPEYRSLFRKAQVYLPTGKKGGGGQENRPLDMFVEDANEKDSKFCQFTQVADLIAYAALMKMRAEYNRTEKVGPEELYGALPTQILNTFVSQTGPRDAIVRLG